MRDIPDEASWEMRKKKFLDNLRQASVKVKMAQSQILWDEHRGLWHSEPK